MRIGQAVYRGVNYAQYIELWNSLDGRLFTGKLAHDSVYFKSFSVFDRDSLRALVKGRKIKFIYKRKTTVAFTLGKRAPSVLVVYWYKEKTHLQIAREVKRSIDEYTRVHGDKEDVAYLCQVRSAVLRKDYWSAHRLVEKLDSLVADYIPAEAHQWIVDQVPGDPEVPRPVLKNLEISALDLK